ncbi:MAG TPA: carboxypeptidase regulatory-like domain-containing protein [Flavobacteriales bacterium]|nr:carboxypeptidase regulatory-like domain-containing protein [Flavobacteriales bacterium]
MRQTIFPRLRPAVAVALVLLASTVVQAQKLKHRMADQYSAVFDYTNMAKVYEDIVAGRNATPADYRQLAFAYKKLGKHAKVADTYKRLMELGEPAPTDLLGYADALRAQGKYEEALSWYRTYSEREPDDEWVKAYLKTGDYFERLQRDSTKDVVRRLPINSVEADMAPAVMEDLLLFSSARGEGAGGKTAYNWDKEPFLNLYSALLKGENATDPMVMRKDVNSRYHDGTATYDPVRKRLYFTRNNFYYGKLSKASNGEVKLGIYYSAITKGEFGQPEWGALVPFTYNDPEYNLGHPSVSPDGKRLYFVSDRPGGRGGTDIWYCDASGDDWGEPVNMGSKVNTPGSEMYPFVATDSTLYFSSTGHPGLGGYDLFSVRLTPSGPGRVFNLGYPMNTAHNDISLILLADDSTGFFASDRPGGQGSLDIYGCTVHPPRIRIMGTVVDKLAQSPVDGAQIEVKDANGRFIDGARMQLLDGGRFMIELPYSDKYALTASRNGYRQGGRVVDSELDDLDHVVLQLEKYDYGSEGIVRHGETKEPLEGAAVRLVKADGTMVEEVVTGPDGHYQFALQAEGDYRVSVEREGFFKQSARISTKGKTNTVIHTDFNLFPLQVDQVVRLDNIYYDLAKWNIRPDAAAELDKLVQTLNDNPTVKIELSSHTDCRGNAAYNQSLSEKRAKSAVEYLIKQGIAKDRLTYKGYGLTKPVEVCECAKCTEEQHQANRRTEFKVLSK